MKYKYDDLTNYIDSVSERGYEKFPKVVLVNTSDVLNGKVLNKDKIENKNLKGQFKKTFKKGDILFSEIRPINKRFANIDFNPDGYVASTKLMVLRKKSDEILRDYIYYFLTSDETLNYLQNQAESRSGTFPQITFKNIAELKIRVPDIYDQVRIVDILKNIDRKIEVNNKIVDNLEEQAQAIFKSWFVDFEPFQDGNFVESELGMIPEGWEVGKLGKSKLGKLIGSGIKEFSGEKIYLATADVSDTDLINTSTIIYFNKRPSRANMQPKPKTIWFAKMKDSRKLILVDDIDNEILENMIFSTGFAGIECNESSLYYLWTYIITEEFDKIKNSYCEGTTMQAINNKNINKILIIVPKDDVLDNYRKIVEPLFKNISRLKVQNKKLAKIRDAILPKLMSGEIDVSNIKIKGEEVKNE